MLDSTPLSGAFLEPLDLWAFLVRRFLLPNYSEPCFNRFMVKNTNKGIRAEGMEIVFEITQDDETLFVAKLADGAVSFGYKGGEGPVMVLPAGHAKIEAVLAIDSVQSYEDVEDVICALFKVK